MMELNKFYQGSTLKVLRTFPDNCIDCCVTSPPYWGLRDYGTGMWVGGSPECNHRRDTKNANPDWAVQTRGKVDNGVGDEIFKDVCRKCGAIRVDEQIGLEKTPEEFIHKLVLIFREVRRVLKPTGTLFVNIGDSYFGSTMTGGNKGMNAQGGKDGFKQQRQFVKPSDARRVNACDTSDKVPVNYQDRDCLCGNLCDGCRVVYQSRKFRNDGSLAPMLIASLFVPNREHKVFVNGHAPNSDSVHLDGHTEASVQGSLTVPPLSNEQIHAFLLSTIGESSQQLQDECLRRVNACECLLCARSLQHSFHRNADKKVCTCDIEKRSDALDLNKWGISSLGLALNNYTDIKPKSSALKPKDLVGIPWMLALALRNDGWWLRQDLIWSKPNPMPESVSDRCTKAHEYIFLLAKSKNYYWDAEAIKEVSTNPDDDRGSRGNNKRVPTEKVAGIRSSGVYPMANKRSVWIIAPKPFAEAHFATFPEELVEPCIKAGSSEYGCCSECGSPYQRIVKKTLIPTAKASFNSKVDERDLNADKQDQGSNRQKDGHKPGWINKSKTKGWKATCKCHAPVVKSVVLDCFSGAGTTFIVAEKLNRDRVAIELNPDYIKISEDRRYKEIGLFANI